MASGGVQATGFTPVFFPGAFSPAVSADGRFVAFSSDATNLVPGDTNASFDIFHHDRTNAVTTRESVASDGRQAAGGPTAAGSSFPDISPERLRGDTTRTVNLTRRLSRDVSRRFLIARLDATNRVREPNEKDNVVVSERLSRKPIRHRQDPWFASRLRDRHRIPKGPIARAGPRLDFWTAPCEWFGA